MDPIDQINPKKDTTLALLYAAQQRGWNLHYMEMRDLRLRDGVAEATTRELSVEMSLDHWYEFLSEHKSIELGSLDVILMRKDPPFDTEFIFSTYILERAELCGTLVVNRPSLPIGRLPIHHHWIQLGTLALLHGASESALEH